jgi:hypothetical protein
MKGYCSYFWMFKVLVFGFRFWKFLLLLLDIEGSYFCSWMLKVLVLLLDVEGFCFCFWMLKVLLTLLDVEDSYFYFLMWKVIVLIFGFKCWKFLRLVLDIEGSYFCSWMFKVLALTFRCWRFLLLDVESSYFYSRMLKVCDSWSFIYLHTLKKNDVKIYSILFKSWLYKFNLTYNDERFMKGVFLMIIMLHMSCFVFGHLWWLLLFLCYRPELSLCINPSASKLCVQG